MKNILAIETSCDETGVAIVQFNQKNIKVLGNALSSQIKLHKKTHGVVPEVAARAHLQKIQPIFKEALTKAGLDLDQIDYISVTAGPGLVTSLLVGVEFAKALSLARHKKIVPVNHMLGHLYSNFIEHPEIKLPSINLIVSGGHTYLIVQKNYKDYKVIGQTVDDAAGEAFDKVAKMLKLPYPGGPEISKAALAGKNDLNFPRPMLNSKNYDFSFAGLKTAVLYKITNDRLDIKDPGVRADIAMSFENAAVDVLVQKTIRAAKEFGAKSVTLSGGVAANKKLRADLSAAAEKAGLKFYVPEMSLCTDNATMIANAAVIKLRNGFKAVGYKNIKVDPNMAI